MTDSIAILGAGAWGTALAVHWRRTPRPPNVRLWARDRDHAAAINAARTNARYLPGIALPDGISAVNSLDDAARGASLLIVATPIAALIDVVTALQPRAKVPLFWLGKGFVDKPDAQGAALAHEVVARMWSSPVGVISGPSFAEEVARGLPTALSVAATDGAVAESVAESLRGDTLRVYVSDDLTGIEVGGAVKNVLAIAAGLSDGLGFGNNARAALITRGLAETGRLSAALGGKRETLMGLAGLGDLVLTCTGDMSRNRRVGIALAHGQPLADILASLGHVAEGVAAARALRGLQAEWGVDLPICDAVYRVLHEGLPPRRAVESLLAREPGREFH